MKAALELLGLAQPKWGECYALTIEALETAVKRAREEMRREACQAAIDAAADGFHDQSASDCADRIVAAIRALPVEPPK